MAIAQSGGDDAKFKEIYERLKVGLPRLILRKVILNLSS